MSRVLFPSDAWHSVRRSSCKGSKHQSLANCQIRKVNICLCLINAFAAEVGLHMLSGNALVVEFCIFIHGETIRIPSYCLKQGGNTAEPNNISKYNLTERRIVIPSRTPKYNTHLACFYKSVTRRNTQISISRHTVHLISQHEPDSWGEQMMKDRPTIQSELGPSAGLGKLL